MCNLSKIVKSKLFSILSHMENNPNEFVVNPNKDFSRKRALSFSTMMKLMISMEGNTIHKELYNFIGFKTDTPTASAFVQQRSKVKVSAFEYLFKTFSSSFKHSKMLNGYELIAVDGSDIHTPTNVNDKNSYFQSNENSKGYNLFHINALYNLLDKRYEDIIIQPRRLCNEHKALCDMIDNMKYRKKVIIVADRGYEGYNNLAHIEQKGWNYVFRIKSASGIISRLTLPDEEEFDIDVSFKLTRQQTKITKAEPDKYRIIMSNMTFDYLPLQSKDAYTVKFRVVRIKLSDNSIETLITNLDKSSFSSNSLKKIYKMRWGIETSFRELKYNVGLVNFHSKKTDFILQEIYARLIMYNFSMIIIKDVCINKNNTVHVYQVNYAEAIYICKHFICNNKNPPNIEALIAKNVLPIRLDRNFKRNIKCKTSVSFMYRVA